MTSHCAASTSPKGFQSGESHVGVPDADCENTLVVFRGACLDSRVAAAVLSRCLFSPAVHKLYRVYSREFGPSGVLSPREPEDRHPGVPILYDATPTLPPPWVYAKRHVWLVGMQFGEAELADIASQARSVRVLARSDEAGATRPSHPACDAESSQACWCSKVSFDAYEGECLAEIAWDCVGAGPAPPLLDYVAASALGTWERRRPDAHEVFAGLRADSTLFTIQGINQALRWDAQLLTHIGAAAPPQPPRARASAVEAACALAQPARLRVASGSDAEAPLRCYTVLAVNASADQARIGQALCAQAYDGAGGPPPEIAAVYNYSFDVTHVHLYAAPDSPLDLAYLIEDILGAICCYGTAREACFSFRGSDIKAFLSPVRLKPDCEAY